jgi:hypothetical protein
MNAFYDGQNILHLYKIYWILLFTVMVSAMVFNDTFNNISVVSWLYVLLVEKTGVDGEYHLTAASHWQTLHIVA